MLLAHLTNHRTDKLLAASQTHGNSIIRRTERVADQVRNTRLKTHAMIEECGLPVTFDEIGVTFEDNGSINPNDWCSPIGFYELPGVDASVAYLPQLCGQSLYIIHYGDTDSASILRPDEVTQFRIEGLSQLDKQAQQERLVAAIYDLVLNRKAQHA